MLDNVAYHHAKKISKWLERHPVLELFFLPPYSPDLNAIERAWWYMRKKITHNRHLKTLKVRKVVFWKMFSHFLKPNDELKNVCESIIRLYIGIKKEFRQNEAGITP